MSRMFKLKCLFCVAVAVLAVACKPQVPDKYIQPDEFEDILYDYHLADAMAEKTQNDDGFQYNKELNRQAVLKKYGITQADFDSTLVYYTRHADRLHGIYENLSERFSKAALALGASANEVNRYGNITSDGDTANVWNGEKSFILTADAPYNIMTFELTADTTFHKGDRLILSFNSDFIFKDGMRDAVALLSMRLGNDSVTYNATHIYSNSKHTVSVSDNDRLGIKSIKGFIYLPKGSNAGGINNNGASLRLMSITNISLVRFHNSEKPVSINTDTIKTDKPDTIKHELIQPKPLPRPGSKPMTLPNGRVLPASETVPPNPPTRPVRKVSSKTIE